MNLKRVKIFIIGTVLGTIYAFITMLIVQASHNTVSLGYVFALPLVLGAIPVLLSTKEQLRSYLLYLIIPCVSALSFFYLSFVSGFEGLICLVIIVVPFLTVGGIGGFIYRLIKLKQEGDDSKKLYLSLLIPFLVLGIEYMFVPEDYYGTVETKIIIHSDKSTVWENIKNVKSIDPSEIESHFIHLIGIPKPSNGELDYEGIGATRSITWEKGIRFEEKITDWQELKGFQYEIIVNPNDIPPQTLDEHVMIGGKYFDAVKGGYRMNEIDDNTIEVTLTSTYRITSTVNFYGKYWADFIFEDFHNMILEIIKKRAENLNI